MPGGGISSKISTSSDIIGPLVILMPLRRIGPMADCCDELIDELSDDENDDEYDENIFLRPLGMIGVEMKFFKPKFLYLTQNSSHRYEGISNVVALDLKRLSSVTKRVFVCG